MNTPWGKSDSKATLARGISFVTTPSHGGFMVSQTAAGKYFTPAAIKRGKAYGAYLAYEEYCDYAIVLLELPQALRLKWSINVPTREKLIQGLSHWHADYLVEVGIEPNAEGLKWFNENRQHDRMREDKSPDLIVSASGDWKHGVPKGMVEVTTAAGTRHFVWADEYATRNTNLTLLSNFKFYVDGAR